MRMKVTTYVLLGSKRHGCQAEAEARQGLRVNNVLAHGPRPRSDGSEEMVSLCNGRSDLGGKQTWRPERLRNDCRPEILGHTEVAVWSFAVEPTQVPGGEGRCAGGRNGRVHSCSRRDTGPSIQGKTRRLTSGRSHLQQGLTATCKDHEEERKQSRVEHLGLAHEPV